MLNRYNVFICLLSGVLVSSAVQYDWMIDRQLREPIMVEKEDKKAIYTIRPQSKGSIGPIKNDIKCGICRNNLGSYEQVDCSGIIKTVCNHYYHAACLADSFTAQANQWRNNHGFIHKSASQERCPVCRQEKCVEEKLISIRYVAR